MNAVLDAFRQVHDFQARPVKAVVYTHSHPDHWAGVAALTSVGVKPYIPTNPGGPVAQGATPIYAHSSFVSTLSSSSAAFSAILPRSASQFGVNLTANADGRVSNGIGPCLAVKKVVQGAAVLFPPWVTFTSELNTTVMGQSLNFFYNPGETGDTIGLWLPCTKTLLSGDNVYKAFPNLYAIRGTVARSAPEWISSIGKLRAFGAVNWAPMHSPPIVNNATEISRVFGLYQDGLKFVHDQTLAQLNKGLPPNDIVPLVQLPKYLAEEPYLQPFYGQISYAVRAVFDFYMGWFSGLPKDLSPLSELAQAERLIKLGGGAEKVLIAAQHAVLENSLAGAQWGLELLDALRRVAPSSAADRAYAQALRLLGYADVSSNGRNFYLEAANAVFVQHSQEGSLFGRDVPLSQMNMQAYSQWLPSQLNVQKSLDENAELRIVFTDEDLYIGEFKTYQLTIRRAVAYMNPTDLEPNKSIPTIYLSSSTFKNIFAHEVSAELATSEGQVSFDHPRTALLFVKVVALFTA